MTNLKSVEEVAKDYFNGAKVLDLGELLTQDRQAHCDELVRLLSSMKKVENVTSDMEPYHDFLVRNAECVGFNQAKDQALTIVKEIYKVKN